MNAASALHEFADLRLWVTWKSEAPQGRKPTKVPYTHTGLPASSTDDSTWTTRAIVEHAAEQRHDGIGIMLAKIDEGRHLGGVDLDSCIDDDGNLTVWAQEIVELLNSYTEVSPSGHGLKIFFLYDPRATLAEGVRWQSAVRRPAPDGGKEPGIEFYLRARYFTVTDQTFEDFDTVRLIDLDTLRAVQAKMSVFADKPEAPNHHPRRHDDDQQRIIGAIARMPNHDLHWNDWNTRCMAIYTATDGSAAGYAAFLGWSAKSAKFDQRACDERWQHYHTSPPDRLTAGTIFHHAKLEKNTQAKSNGAAIENAADRMPDWPDIDPALVEDTRRHIPVFPVHLFSPEWRKWTVATAEGAGAPIDYVGSGVLGCVAGVSGCGILVEVTPSWCEPVVVWPAVVGAPSMGKTPGLAATRRLIDAVESDARLKDADRQRDHETKIEAAKIAEEKWRDEVAEAADAGKPPPTKPAAADHIEPFVPTQVVIADATTESVIDVVQGNPRGVVLYRDELTGWLQNFARYSSGSDRPFWLETWSAGPATVNRKKRLTVRIARLAVSIMGGIQPDRLGEICGDDDDGMASRFLFAWPERPPYKPLQERRVGDDTNAVKRLQRIFSLAGNVEKPLVLKFDAGAMKLFDEFCAEHHAEASEYEGVEAGWFGKGPGHVVRLAAVLSLLAWSETGSAGPPSAITADAVRDAAGLWADYYWPIARTIFARTGRTLADRQVRRIIAWIRRTKASDISVEDVRVHALGRTVGADAATALIGRLVRGNVLHPATAIAKGPGRPATRWDVNPGLHAPKPGADHA